MIKSCLAHKQLNRAKRSGGKDYLVPKLSSIMSKLSTTFQSKCVERGFTKKGERFRAGTAPTQLRGSSGRQQDQGRRSTSPSFKGTRNVTTLRILIMELDCTWNEDPNMKIVFLQPKWIIWRRGLKEKKKDERPLKVLSHWNWYNK
jgi:hypothetical protein